MGANDLHSVVKRTRPLAVEQISEAEKCLVATTADDITDEVYVTMPFAINPDHREKVMWRLEFQWVGGLATPRWPTRGDKGIIIKINSGELWLIY